MSILFRKIHEIMSLCKIIVLLVGCALFLYGMSLIGDGFKQAAGNKMELVLVCNHLSGSSIKGILLGTAVATVIQSGSTTSVKVVGFVGSAKMMLYQATSVIISLFLSTSVSDWRSFASTATLSDFVAMLEPRCELGKTPPKILQIQIKPGKDAMCHIKDLEFKRTEKVEDVLNIGDKTYVKFLGVDEKSRWNVSARPLSTR